MDRDAEQCSFPASVILFWIFLVLFSFCCFGLNIDFASVPEEKERETDVW